MCRVAADEEIVCVAAILAADQPEYGQEANSEEGEDGCDSPSYSSPTELISIHYLINQKITRMLLLK